MPTDLPEWLLLLLAGPFIGSFLGVLAVRLPEGRNVVFGRSHCDSCEHALAARDLIPLLSWLAVKGRCRYCGTRIGIVAPLVEMAATAVVLWAMFAADGTVLVASCALGWLLLTVALIDWRHGMLPDVLTATLFLCGLAATWFIAPAELPAHLIGALAGFAMLGSVALAYGWLRGREGLGLGDAKLLGALGAWIGWQGLPATILIGALTALLVVLVRRWSGPLRATDSIAFGPFLALGGWIVWLYGPLIV